MASESYPEPKSEFEQHVDDAFLDYTDRSPEGRMGMAAFELVEYIDEERDANMDMLQAWVSMGKDTPRMAFVSGLLKMMGFANAAFGFALAEAEAAHKVKPPEDKIPLTVEEINKKEARLKKARQQMHEAMASISEMHNLSYREIKKAQSIARSLEDPKLEEA